MESSYMLCLKLLLENIPYNLLSALVAAAGGPDRPAAHPAPYAREPGTQLSSDQKSRLQQQQQQYQSQQQL
jgi:hypothetical protein